MPSTTAKRKSSLPVNGKTTIVTIDGPAGVGKSTVAKLVAKRLGILYLDTGATYRSLAYVVNQHPEVNPVTDAKRIAALGRQMDLHLTPRPDGSLQVIVNGKDVTRKIRTEKVTQVAADISQHPEVRKAMVALQRKLADQHGVVVEGRDTGSVVFPNATYKFFLDADAQVRAKRRQEEMLKLYGTSSPLKFVRDQIELRDGLDRTRRVGPLVKPKGATEIDTSHCSIAQVVRLMLTHIQRTAGRNKR